MTSNLVRAAFGEVLDLLDGDFKDRTNSRGNTYTEELARQMFLDQAMAEKLNATAQLPQVRAAVDRAVVLNRPKQDLLDIARRCQERGGYDRSDYKGGQVAFHFDLPYVLMPLDEKHGPLAPAGQRPAAHVYMPCNRDYAPLGELGKATGGSFWDYDDYPERAWHFRRDPREIEGAWLDPPNVLYLYGAADREYPSDRAFMEIYRKRLRLVLAEAVPGAGPL
jgi:hypothetical protein